MRHADLPDAATGGAERRAGIVGTFDVENYGDLLFPLIAQGELQRRNPAVQVTAYSVCAKQGSDWPYPVRSVRDLAQDAPDLHAVLIGGGQIVRFDGGYPVTPPAGMRMPLDYWLVPAMVGALAGKPVFWNAVGAWTHSPQAPWLRRPVQEAFAASRFVGVRDRASLDLLQGLAPEAALHLLPDTAFGLGRLWPLVRESDGFARWRASIGLDGDYAVIQASAAMGFHRDAIAAQMRAMGVTRAVVLPVCWCHGDRAERLPDRDGTLIPVPDWLHPRLLAEIIARSAVLFASSLHASITAVSYGVPVARAELYTDRKFDLLAGFDGVVAIDDPAGPARLAQRGRGVEPLAHAHADRLAAYWDSVAAAIATPDCAQDAAGRLRMLDLFASLCDQKRNAGPLANTLARAKEPLMFVQRRQFYFRHNLGRIRDHAAAAVHALLRRQPAPVAPEPIGDHRPILNLPKLQQLQLATEPYQWAFVDQLYGPADALALARSFPRDQFREVAGHDGEKGYQYLSRSLVHMGAQSITAPEGLSPAWRRLVADLLSDTYRDALSRATGLDLSAALMEVNAIRFGPGAWLGPHLDLREKIATHILYFNETWDAADGGCLEILNSADPDDRTAEIVPLTGHSAVLVRSDRSWHAVSRVRPACRATRKNINVIFHLPGAVSTMWVPGERYRLRTCPAD